MPGESPSATSARISRQVLQRGGAWSDYSLGELWSVVRHRFDGRLSRRSCHRAYGMMATLTGDFDAQRAADVVAAVLTREGRPLHEDGSLSRDDLDAFLRLC